MFCIHFFLLLPLCGLALPERRRDELAEHLPASVVRCEMQPLTNFTSKAAEQKQPVCPAKLNLGTVFNRGGKDEWFSTGRRNSLVYIAVYCIGGDYPLLSRLEYSDQSSKLD